eukprot:scaffold69160_cov58-Phaeocystis_antarctica.AAC.2
MWPASQEPPSTDRGHRHDRVLAQARLHRGRAGAGQVARQVARHRRRRRRGGALAGAPRAPSRPLRQLAGHAQEAQPIGPTRLGPGLSPQGQRDRASGSMVAWGQIKSENAASEVRTFFGNSRPRRLRL